MTARPMGRVSPHPKKTDWAMSFVTDGRSRKAAEIRRSGKATLVFQRGDEDAYVALIGSARLSERARGGRIAMECGVRRLFPDRRRSRERRFHRRRRRAHGPLDSRRHAGAIRDADDHAGPRARRRLGRPVARTPHRTLKRRGNSRRKGAHPIASSSSIMRSITERPIVQKPGSFASRPNGASSSE